MNKSYIYGMITHEINQNCKNANFKKPLSPSDINGMAEHPEKFFGPVMLKAIQSGVIDNESNDRISRLVDMINPDDSGPADTGSFFLGYYQYDTRQVTVAEAAEVLGVTTKRIYALIKSGELKGYKVLGEWIIYQRGVDERLKKKKNEQ